MKSTNEDQTPTFGFVEPEYEWGVKYHAPGGEFRTDWGFNEDPRTGFIDEDGEIEVGLNYVRVVAVGRRVKSPEVWENL